jgi:regulator of protease activity HflC (stomatin/prohibitin superfamily)
MKRWSERGLDGLFALVRAALWLFEGVGRCAQHRVVRSAARIAVVGAGHALIFLGISFLFFQRITPGQIGVRQDQLGADGVEARDYGPGLHRSLRWLQDWRRLDARLHVAAFGLPGDSNSAPALALRTTDGNLVSVCAAVVYRIRPGEAWRLVADGLEGSYAQLARDAAASLLRSELAQLSSEDFASTDVRQGRMVAALERLNETLRPLHLEAETIQLHDVGFWGEYEKALEQERFARESTRLNESLARLESEKRGDSTAEEIDALEKRIRADGDRRLETLRSRALLEIARIDAEAESYAVLTRSAADGEYERNLAEGALAVARTEAARERTQGEILSGEAGRIWLAREAAGGLKLKRARLDAADQRVPPLVDLDAWVRLWIGGD